MRFGDTRYDHRVPESPSLGPALLKRRLGEELRKLRTAANVTVAQTAAELGSSEAKVRHLENGRNVPSKPDLTVMIGLYHAPPGVHADLEELRQAATMRGWWSSYRLPGWLHNFVGMEADASLIRNFELELIPGLLQTEAYAREIHQLGKHLKHDERTVNRLVRARLKRQEILTREQPATFHAVISEAALHRLRDTDFALDQCRHLLRMADRPNVTITVLPFAKRLHQSMSGGFILLSFPDDSSAPVAYSDYAFGGQMEHEPNVVAQLSEVFDELAEQALSEKQSAEFIGDWLQGERK
ncbi:MAG TPA: helix-turn-helix transcriptional regulator [Actinophytocola sp.]|uniref:helix-turn-helix domain-containing protein n=1 Tax=Actinophytocola sp. TaxID=1872138 RepID=UPI002F926E06